LTASGVSLSLLLHVGRVLNQLIDKLGLGPEKEFFENGLAAKTDFIACLAKLIVSIERSGDSVKEAKQMTAPGSVIESLSPGATKQIHAIIPLR
jgi:hypothetical protein